MSPIVVFQPEHRHHPTRFLPPFLVLALVGLALTVALKADWGRSFYARFVKPAVRRVEVTFATMALDRDAQGFKAQTSIMARSGDCFPMHVRDVNQIGILYVYCSPESQAKDGEGRTISENFSIPEGLARRVNFWRRVYALWGKDQYAMHSSRYPEIVLAVFDTSRLGADVGAVMREIRVKREARKQRDAFRQLLLSMHRRKDHPEQFSPAMERIAQLMTHIDERDKYLKLAQTLRLQRGQRDFIANGLTVAGRYLPAIELEFANQGMPYELTRLAFVESSFNVKAYSKVGAAGVYQIMPATGRQYLRIFNGVDERQDPIKASRAAAKLLRLNYEMTGSWPLAITAYNHGVGGIRKAIRAVGSEDLETLIKRYDGPQFGFASKNFYASFLAVLSTLTEADRLFPEVPRPAPLAFESIRLAIPMTIAQLKRKYNLTVKEIAEYNLDISYRVLRAEGVLPRGYEVKVPLKAAASDKEGRKGYFNTSAALE